MESETLCWDRLLANMGTAVLSSTRRTADRGRSLGWEAVKEGRAQTEAHVSQLTRTASSDECQIEANVSRTDLRWSVNEYRNYEDSRAIPSETANAYTPRS